MKYEVHCKEGPVYRPIERIYCGEGRACWWKKLSAKWKVFSPKRMFTESRQQKYVVIAPSMLNFLKLEYPAI